MKQPEVQSKKYETLISNVESGYVKIPKFQREFVWSVDQTARLLDSILKGYPIGTFILWKTRERLRSIKNIGGAQLPETPKGDSVQYVLDGQQRLTSLYATLSGLEIQRDNKLIDYKEIYVDLDEDEESEEQIISTTPKENSKTIRLYDLLNSDISYLFTHYQDYINKIDTYKKNFTTYDFSTIVISDYPIDVACEVFTRINTGGQELTLFEIMVAKTYDQEQNFDLQVKYEELQEELADVNYDTIPSSTILQCVAMNLVDDCSRKSILRLDKQSVIDIWDKTVEAIKEAVDYFRFHYRIPVSRILPYNALLIPFTYFYFKNHCN